MIFATGLQEKPPTFARRNNKTLRIWHTNIITNIITSIITSIIMSMGCTGSWE